MFCLSNVSALSLLSDQTTNINSYSTSDKGNMLIKSVVGSYSITHNQTIILGNTSYQYDYDIELSNINEDFYIIIENYFVNTTINMIWYGNLVNDPTANIQNFTLNEQGRYYFKFSPSFTDEAGRIYFNVENPIHIINLEYQEMKPAGFNSFMFGIITAFVDFINIQMSFWYLAYYVIIFILMLSIILGLFGLSFLIYKYTQKLKEKKKNNINIGEN